MNDGLDVMLRTGDYLTGRRDTVDDVLEIIKEEQDNNFKCDIATNVLVANAVLENLAYRVLALKGGKQE